MHFGASEWLATAWALCLGIGLCSGFLAGLLGVGGGIVIVPALILGARPLGIDTEDAAPMAMATSMAIVIPTSISSARACSARVHPLACVQAPGARDRLRRSGRDAPGLCVEAAPAARGVRRLRAVRRRPTADRVIARRCGPGAHAAGYPRIGRAQRSHRPAFGAGRSRRRPAVGAPAGALHSREAGNRHGRCARPAPCGGGIEGYVLAGHPRHCAVGCFGYVFLPGAVSISLAAIVSAPLGARVAHRMLVQALRRAFAALLLLVAADLSGELFR